jgi:lysophospholipase L1-like esterase
MFRICRKLAIATFATFVFALAVELIARAAEPGPMRLLDVSPYEKVVNLLHVHRPRARVQWDGTFYEINQRGWRGPEFEPTFAPDELRVVAIGDSCTFGKSVEESECWPRQLERLLQADVGSSRTVRVANLGVNGYSGRDYLEAFRTQALAVRPQLVVLAYNINDFPNVVKRVDAAVFQGGENLRAKVPWDLRAQLGKLAAFRWLRATYYEANRAQDFARVERVAQSVSSEESTSSEALDEERERLAALVDECKALGARVVMFLVPYESQVYLEQYSHAPLDGARSIAEPLGILCLNLVDPFREAARASEPMTRLFVRGDRYHPNAEGYSILARGVRDALQREGWIGAAK